MIYVGIDNGVTGSIGFIAKSFDIFMFCETPTYMQQDYTKKKKKTEEEEVATTSTPSANATPAESDTKKEAPAEDAAKKGVPSRAASRR